MSHACVGMSSSCGRGKTSSVQWHAHASVGHGTPTTMPPAMPNGCHLFRSTAFVSLIEFSCALWRLRCAAAAAKKSRITTKPPEPVSFTLWLLPGCVDRYATRDRANITPSEVATSVRRDGFTVPSPFQVCRASDSIDPRRVALSLGCHVSRLREHVFGFVTRTHINREITCPRKRGSWHPDGNGNRQDRTSRPAPFDGSR